MLKVAEKSRAKKRPEPIRSFFDLGKAEPVEFDPAAIVHDGFVVLSASAAESVLKACRYEGQVRDLTVGGKKHIRVLADIMKRGAWRAKDKLDFARLDNKLILINGHHRMSSQAASGVAIEWTIVIHDCASAEEVSTLYYSFDTNLRIRTNHNILAATGIAEEMGIAPSAAEALYRAVPLIEAGFDFSVAARDPIMERVIDRRLERMRSFQKEAIAFDAAIKGAPKQIKKKLRAQGALCVALTAFKHQPELAADFWGGVAQNDGLRKGDARHTYLRLLQSEIGASGTTAEVGARAAAVAWNAFYDGRQITFIRTTSGPIRIDGTPYRGK